MKLKVNLISTVGLFYLLAGHYNNEQVAKTSKYGSNSQKTACSLLAVLESVSKRRESSSYLTEASDSDFDSKDASSSQNNKVKKDKGRNKKMFRDIPSFFRRIFKKQNKNKNNITSRRNAVRRRNCLSEDSSTDDETEQSNISTTRARVGPGSKARTELGPNPSPKSDPNYPSIESEVVVEAAALSPGEELPLPPLDTEETNSKHSGKGLKFDVNGGKMQSAYRTSYLSELDSIQHPRSESYSRTDSLILEDRDAGIENMLKLSLTNLYSYLDHHISANTGGIPLLVSLNEVLLSTQVNQKLIELGPAEGDIGAAVRGMYKQQNEKYRERKGSLFKIFHESFGEDCNFELMDSLVVECLNAFMEFKLVEGDFENVLDPRKGTSSERAENIHRCYSEMKAAKSKMRKLLLKYVNCHFLIFFNLRIDDIITGSHEEKCTAQDLVTLRYYQNVCLALKRLNHLSFKEKELEVADYQRMLISGHESPPEGYHSREQVLGQLSRKVFILYVNAILFGSFVEVIDKKLSWCLTYILNNYKQNQNIETTRL